MTSKLFIPVVLVAMMCLVTLVAADDPWEGYVPDSITGEEPLTVDFTDISYNSPTAWIWQYKDVTGANVWTTFNTTQNPTQTFMAGNYSIRLNSSNSYGYNITPSLAFVNVSAEALHPPVSDFIADPLTGTTPLHVTFTDTSTNSPVNWSWYWYSNETLSSSLQNPSPWLTTGSYNVRLKTCNADGCDFENKSLYIVVSDAVTIPPVAQFQCSPVIGTVPLTVNCGDLSTGSPTGWFWSFGDGNYSSSQNPSHTYAATGLFTVYLQAINAGGYDYETKTNYIAVNPASTPTPTPTATPTGTWTPTPTPTPTPTYTPAPPYDSGYSPHMRAMAVTTIPTIPNERYLPFLGMLGMGYNETVDTPNWSAVPGELTGVYTDYMGPIAFLLIFLIPFGMIWLAHGNMKLLGILGLIVCGFVFLYLPATYQAAAIMCILVSAAALLWGLFKQ